MKERILIVGILVLLIISTVPVSFGNVRTNEKLVESYSSDRYLYPEYYDCYNSFERTNHEYFTYNNNFGNSESKEIDSGSIPQPLDGPLDSAWPMYCHDIRHTGRSLYSTADNPGENIWFLKLDGYIEGSGVIDNNGIIYFGGSWNFYALDSINRSIIWVYDFHGEITSSPAIDENGIIYVGKYYPEDGLYAFYPNGTLKWRYAAGSVYSSPVIGEDGSIYFSTHTGWEELTVYVQALYPNGTLKWNYRLNDQVFSSPAIGDDGTVYVGSIDTYLYALYPNNGTLKWKYKTDNWVHGSPTVDEDGIIYFGSDDGYLYALYPNGTLKWRCSIGAVWGAPALDEDGTLYVGVWDKMFYAINPDGTIKWTFNAPGRIWFSSAALSLDGTIYFGTTGDIDGGSGRIIALNHDGTERWSQGCGDYEFAPIIDSNGLVYVGNSLEEKRDIGGVLCGYEVGFFYIFGELDPFAPYAPDIHGPSECKLMEYYNFTFNSNSPLNKDIYYLIDWGDDSFDGWTGPYQSGQKIELNHRWWYTGTHTIRCRAKDIDDRWGPWSSYEVIIKKSKIADFDFIFMKLLEKFPLLERLLIYLSNQ